MEEGLDSFYRRFISALKEVWFRFPTVELSHRKRNRRQREVPYSLLLMQVAREPANNGKVLKCSETPTKEIWRARCLFYLTDQAGMNDDELEG